MVRASILAAASFIALSVAHAADLEGISMPDTRVVDGTQMRLNGIGLRTFSALGIRIYVAGLYLERRNGEHDDVPFIAVSGLARHPPARQSSSYVRSDSAMACRPHNPEAAGRVRGVLPVDVDQLAAKPAG